jgi:predicted dehydrogenase
VVRQRGLLLYDIMTERYNTLCILQKLLVQDGDVFGELEQGSPAEPAVVKESVHHFFKYVAGKPIRRPTWYFDTAQQGEGLVDVTTHLIDLVMWTCFPEQPIRWAGEVAVERARHWPTPITRQQYAKVTGATDFPDFLRSKLNEDGVLPYYCNGEMLFAIKGVHVGITVKWDFEAPQDGGDTHHSLFRGSRARVIIRQGKEQDYRPQLHVEPAPGTDPQRLRIALDRFIARLQTQYPGLALAPRSRGWQVLVPQEHLIGHEAHFRQVTEKYLHYLSQGALPEWEIAYMKTKYHITTTAWKLARQ